VNWVLGESIALVELPTLTTQYSCIHYWRVFLICVSMIWSILAYSMHFGWALLVWVVLQCQMCPTTVESMAEGGLHWTLGVYHGTVGCWAWRHCHQWSWWWCMVHIRVGKACGGVQQGDPSANVAKLCHPPRTMSHSMLIMALLVLSIGSIQYIMDLLANVLNVLNEVVSSFSFGLNVNRIYPCGCKWYG